MRPDKTPETWKQFHKDFRNHDPKIKAAQEFLNLCQGAFLLDSENLQRIVKELAERELELRKKVAFVELTSDNRFQMPSPDLHTDCQRFMEKIKLVFTILYDMIQMIYQCIDTAATSTGSA